jgi:phage terminase large subunit-like protein
MDASADSVRLKVAELRRRSQQRKILTYFPDEGPLRRELYHKHLSYFAAGKDKRERLMLAANRVGKTESVGGYEVTLHLTGDYPEWWDGRRYSKPVRVWAAGDTSETVRNILQEKLLGKAGEWGTGLIPGDSIVKITRKAGSVAETVDTIYVKRKDGGISRISLKSYEQGRKGFQGTEPDIIWLDEEPPEEIYTECLTRTMTNNGMVMLTFTPLEGMSKVVLTFLPNGKLDEKAESGDSRFVVMATWDDAPHLSPEVKDELYKKLPPHQRDARSKGVPQLGSGAIYPVPESEFTVAPFAIPPHWPRAYGMDVGWNRTAAIWGARDLDTDTVYLYHEYYRSQAEPSVHVHGIHAPGKWIPGTIDPASRGRSQKDGAQLIQDYRDLGLNLGVAQNSVESGLYDVWQRLSAGKIKVFSTLNSWFAEYRLYRRDEKGKIVKENDHLMDAMRYLIVSGIDRMITEPKPMPIEATPNPYGEHGWMA